MDEGLPRRGLFTMLDLVGLVLAVAPALYVAVEVGDLPARVPIHFGADGQADGWAGKGSLWLMPVVTLMLYVTLTAVGWRPRIWNLPATTERTRPRVVYVTALMLRAITLETTAMFLYITMRMVEGARSGDAGLGSAFLPVVLIGVFGTIAVGAVAMRVAAREDAEPT